MKANILLPIDPTELDLSDPKAIAEYYGIDFPTKNDLNGNFYFFMLSFFNFIIFSAFRAVNCKYIPKGQQYKELTREEIDELIKEESLLLEYPKLAEAIKFDKNQKMRKVNKKKEACQLHLNYWPDPISQHSHKKTVLKPKKYIFSEKTDELFLKFPSRNESIPYQPQIYVSTPKSFDDNEIIEFSFYKINPYDFRRMKEEPELKRPSPMRRGHQHHQGSRA